MQKKAIKTEHIFFGLTVWIFLSLNAKDFNFSVYNLLRWLFPVVLAFFACYKRNGEIPYPPLFISLFAVAVAPSVLVSPNITESLMKAISFVWIVYGFYICFWGTKNEKELEELFRITCVLLILFQILNAFYCLIGLGGEAGGRYSGFTTNANTLGIYSNLALWATYYFYRNSKGWKKAVMLLIFLTSVILALLSGSRSAFVMILLNVIIICFLQTKTKISRLVVFLVVLVFLGLLFTGKLAFLNITALDRLLMEGGASRTELWSYALNVWEENPIFGCGYRVSKLFNNLSGSVGMDFHNSYVSLLVEVGIWGVLFIGIAIVPMLIVIGKQTQKEIVLKAGQEFIVASFMALSLLINAWSESFLFSVGSTEAFMFWMLFVWMINYLKKSNKEKKGKLLG